jgi:hypothetical protein
MRQAFAPQVRDSFRTRESKSIRQGYRFNPTAFDGTSSAASVIDMEDVNAFAFHWPSPVGRVGKTVRISLPLTSTGLASIRMKAVTAGTEPLLTQV